MYPDQLSDILLGNPAKQFFHCPVTCRLAVCQVILLITQPFVWALNLFCTFFQKSMTTSEGYWSRATSRQSTQTRRTSRTTWNTTEVPSLRPKPGAPNSCDRAPPGPPRPLPPFPPALLAYLPLLSPAPLAKIFTPDSARWHGCSGRAEFKCKHPDLPLLSIPQRSPPTESDWPQKPSRSFFLSTANTSGGGERPRDIRCIWNKNPKIF